MEWLDSMAAYGQDHTVNEGHVGELEEEEDFYGDEAYAVDQSHTMPGATNHNGQTSLAQELNASDQNEHNFQANNSSMATATVAPSAEDKKAENLKKADMLRAKLMAQRPGTPMKMQSRANTPNKSSSVAPVSQPKIEPQPDLAEATEQQQQSPDDVYGIASLLAEGKAAAEAKTKQQLVAFQEPPHPSKIDVPSNSIEQLQDQRRSSVPHGDVVAPPTATVADQAQASLNQQSKQPDKLSDAYYADLSIWLEITGYHDLEFRQSKVHTFRERQALEAEAARIQERLDKLRDAEQATIQSLRITGAHRATTTQPPALPSLMPSASTGEQNRKPAQAAANGHKRTHSPELAQPSKARREESTNGFRIRGANASPDGRGPPARGRMRSQPPPSAGRPERRTVYQDERRYPNDGRNSRPATRDHSLERRQAYYNHEADAGGFDRDRHAPYQSRDVTRGFNHGRARTSFDGNNARDNPHASRRGAPQHYQDKYGLDLKRGGVRFFMIKSWNNENVVNAMRDELWATQLKNEQLLSEAYNTSRHVILLFSVNKSTAFQGYALMASPFDKTLPKPPFCAKLNWATSPAFKLRWLAKTAVHFKHVGHLKNTLNIDEYDQPMAVLIGKDGQEVSADAGRGVVEILDDAEKDRP